VDGSSPRESQPKPSVGQEAGADAGSGKGDGGEASPGGASDGGAANLWAGAANGAGTKGEAGGGLDGGAAGELTGPSDAGSGGASTETFVPAPHAQFPLVTDHGGPLLKNIELVPVYFGTIHSVSNSNVSTPGLLRVTIGSTRRGIRRAGRYATSCVQFESVPGASLSDTQIADWIDARVADGKLPKPSANTVFALFYQAGPPLLRARQRVA
jgi:hypothetical protein